MGCSEFPGGTISSCQNPQQDSSYSVGPDNRGGVTLTDVTKRCWPHATPLETGNCFVGVRSYVALCNVWRMRLMSGWEMAAEPRAFCTKMQLRGLLSEKSLTLNSPDGFVG